MVSKHHYAIELGKRGNNVLFLNPPDRKCGKRFSLIPSGHQGVTLISHSLLFPYILKFHLLPLFHFLMRWHIKYLLRQIGQPIDIVWSFDIGNIYPLRFFPSTAKKIFHPVDEPLNKAAINSAKGADILFSVTNEIIGKYAGLRLPSYFVNHGVQEKFLEHGVIENVNKPIRIGFSGNLLRKDIDRETLITIIKSNQEVVFDFWGSLSAKNANMGGIEDVDLTKFIQQLDTCANVRLNGVLKTDELALAYSSVDGFLICYDIQKDQSKGTNYHKIMEFLGTGKVVVSNNVTTYKDFPGMLVMSDSRLDNNKLPEIFRSVVSDIGRFNSPELVEARRMFAANNTYSCQVEKIEEYLLAEFEV